MKKIYFILLSLLCLVIGGCEEENADTPIPFVIYGTVVESRTGEPLRGAEVSLHTGSYNPSAAVGTSSPEGSVGTAVTGTDGQYEMHCTVTENIQNQINYHFTLYITAYGHSAYRKDVTLHASKDLRIQVDAAM